MADLGATINGLEPNEYVKLNLTMRNIEDIESALDE